MSIAHAGWTRFAGELDGPRFAEFQTALTNHNAQRFTPGLPQEASESGLALDNAVAAAEIEFIEAQRKKLAPLVRNIPSDADGFIAWFEGLKETGPGQGDPLFPWLADRRERRRR